MFVSIDGFLEVDLVANDLANSPDFIIEPVIFASGDVAIDGFDKGRGLLFTSVEYSLAVFDDLLTTSFRYPVFCLQFVIFGLEAFSHFRRDTGGKQAKQSYPYLNHRHLRQHMLQQHSHQMHSLFDIFFIETGQLVIDVLADYLQESIGVHINDIPIFIFHKLLQVPQTTRQHLHIHLAVIFQNCFQPF